METENRNQSLWVSTDQEETVSYRLSHVNHNVAQAWWRHHTGVVTTSHRLGGGVVNECVLLRQCHWGGIGGHRSVGPLAPGLQETVGHHSQQSQDGHRQTHSQRHLTWGGHSDLTSCPLLHLDGKSERFSHLSYFRHHQLYHLRHPRHHRHLRHLRPTRNVRTSLWKTRCCLQTHKAPKTCNYTSWSVVHSNILSSTVCILYPSLRCRSCCTSPPSQSYCRLRGSHHRWRCSTSYARGRSTSGCDRPDTARCRGAGCTGLKTGPPLLACSMLASGASK